MYYTMHWATSCELLLSHVSPSAQEPVSRKAQKHFRGQILKSKPLEYLSTVPSAQTSQFCFVNLILSRNRSQLR